MKPVWLITTIGVHALGLFLVVGTLLPFFPVGAWLVRGWDFPRVHVAVACLVVLAMLAALALFRGWRIDIPIAGALLLAALAWQASRIAPYTRLWPTTVAGSSAPADLRVLVANLEVDNDRHDEVAGMIEDTDPDVLLLIEIDSVWADALAPLRERFGRHADDVREDGLGIAFWSKLPLVGAEVRELVSEKRPSIHAAVELEGGRRINIVGVHPTPPGLRRDHDGDDQDGRYDSRIRDAELVLVARQIADRADGAWIVAGDFNDVAWSRTTRLFQELSGLRDPRVGRGFYNTYHARYRLLRYPVDHVFVSPGFAVADMRRLEIPGSDHFAILADLVLSDPSPPRPDAGPEEREEAEEIVDEGLEDAADNGEAPRD